MRIVVAEDDPVSRRLVEHSLRRWGFEPVATADGNEALRILEMNDAPKMAILDWGLPGLDGLEICRRVRKNQTSEPVYLILLTGRDAKDDILAGFDAGANDYVTKPFDIDELRARVRVGRQVADLQHSLTGRVHELEQALSQVKQLRTLLPICSYCRKIRDDNDYWQQVEGYFVDNSEIRFSHGICPDCYDRVMKEIADAEAKAVGPANVAQIRDPSCSRELDACRNILADRRDSARCSK